MESSKLALQFSEPFALDQIVNPLAVCLKLPSSLKVCPPFHVSLLKLLSELVLVLPSEAPSPPRDRWQSIIHRLTNFGGLPTRTCSIVPGRMEGVWSRGEVVASYILDKDLVRDFYYDHPD